MRGRYSRRNPAGVVLAQYRSDVRLLNQKLRAANEQIKLLKELLAAKESK